MRSKRRLVIAGLVIILSLLFPAAALAQQPGGGAVPAMPAVYAGTVKTVSGADAPDGAVISARVGNWTSPTSLIDQRDKVSGGKYSWLQVSPPQGYEGLPVEFLVDEDGDGPLPAVKATPSLSVTFKAGAMSGFDSYPPINLTYTPPAPAVLLKSISVSPATVTLSRLGQKQQFQAAGTYTDDTTKDITDEVAWQVSDVTVVVLVADIRGQVVVVGAGQATIKAVKDSIQGSAVLTVELPAPTPTPSPTPAPPAKLSVTALSVTPGEVSPDEAITVTATVENTGGQSGSLDVQLKVNGAVVETKTVGVDAGKSGQATFTLNRSAAGTYTVDVAGKTGTVKVLSPAAFSVSGLSVEPAKVKPGEAVTATARVTNTGELAGSYSASLKVDGETTETKSVTLDPGAGATVSFSVPTDVGGTRTVDIGGQTATIEVTRGFNVWVVIGPIFGVIVVALAVFMIMRRLRT